MNKSSSFPKNIPQSFITLLIVIITTIIVMGLFEYSFQSFFTNNTFFLITKSFFSYLASLIVLHLVSKKSPLEYNFNIPNYGILLLVVLSTVFFALSIGIPLSYFLKDYFGNTGNVIMGKSPPVNVIIGTIIFAPFFEELIMRGFLLEGLLRKNNAYKSIAITTIIITLIHFDIIKTIPSIFSGILLGWIYFKTRNLLFPVLAHLSHNLITTYEPYFFKNFRSSNLGLKFYGDYTVLIILVFLILLISTIYFIILYFKNENRRLNNY